MTTLNLFATPELCKKCVFYDPRYKTCKKSVVAISKSKEYHDFAKSVRNDPDRCGIEALWFEKK